MTGKKIKEDALLYAALGGYNIQDPTAVNYINRAVDVIMRNYDEVGKITTEEYIIGYSDIGVLQDLPDDFLVSKRIYCKGTDLSYAEDVSSDYLIQNDQIRFDIASTFVMEYVPIPEYLSNIELEAPLNPMWHPAISFYVAYRAKAEVFGDEEGEKNELYMRFESYCKKVSGRLNRRKTNRRMKAPMWG